MRASCPTVPRPSPACTRPSQTPPPSSETCPLTSKSGGRVLGEHWIRGLVGWDGGMPRMPRVAVVSLHAAAAMLVCWWSLALPLMLSHAVLCSILAELPRSSSQVSLTALQPGATSAKGAEGVREGGDLVNGTQAGRDRQGAGEEGGT